MSVLEIFLIGVALSMDAFAVSISNGLIIRQVTFRKAAVIALTYGIYQFLMPVIGYIGASFFYRFICFIDHWIAFGLLGFLGGKMIIDSIREMLAEKKAPCQQDFADNDDYAVVASVAADSRKIAFLSFKTLMMQGVATSIDALAVGISFAAISMQRSTYTETLLASAVYPSLLIGLTTTSLCLPAVFIGKKTGERLGDKAQLFGGTILIGIGVKILIEHLFGAN